jgi:NAD-dependent dihydropyrimidine dehydrogenase PreA subunit
VNQELCTGCEACVLLCPKQLLYIDEKSGICNAIRHNQCDRLRGCERVCPTGAIKIY